MLNPSLPTPPTALELQILGHLKGAGGHCDALTALPKNPQASLRQHTQACRRLRDRGWVDYRLDVTQFGLTLAGKTLLSLDTSVWPVTPDERLVLRSCRGGRIAPGQIHHRVPHRERQALVRRLAVEGLVVVYGEAIVNLGLTPAGAGRASSPANPGGTAGPETATVG